MKRSEILLMVLHVPLDFFMLIIAAIAAYYLRFTDWAIGLKPIMFNLTLPDFISIASWVALGWLLIFALSGLYSTDPNRKLARDITRIFFACATGLAAVAVYILFTQQLFDSRFLVAAGSLFAFIFVLVGRLFMRGIKALMYRAGFGLRRVAVIGDDAVAEAILRALKERRGLGYNVVSVFKRFDHSTANHLDKLHLDEVIFTNPRADEKETLAALAYCDTHHIIFKYSADLFATLSTHMSVHPLAGVPIVELKKTPLEGWGRVAKRLFDIIISIIIIVITSPLMLLAAFIIVCETGWPIIYKNERVGIRGRKFFTLKFRSMYQKYCTGAQFGGKRAEAKERELIEEGNTRQGPIYKIANDPRVSRFGRFMRRCSIDELPQFFNVLGGSMSIVGPRPHQPREVAHYEEHYPKVFTLKPGITGLAQISGRSDLAFDDEMRLDVLYIEKWNLLLDGIIFLKTPFVLLRKRKAL